MGKKVPVAQDLKPKTVAAALRKSTTTPAPTVMDVDEPEDNYFSTNFKKLSKIVVTLVAPSVPEGSTLGKNAPIQKPVITQNGRVISTEELLRLLGEHRLWNAASPPPPKKTRKPRQPKILEVQGGEIEEEEALQAIVVS